MNLSEKLIATLSKAKSIDEMIEAYQKCGEWLHEEIEKHRKELIEKANKLPKINERT